MKIGILTIGNELTSGRIADTNTSYLAREFHVRGWDVPVSMAVGDYAEAIGEALDFILERSDAVVVTGGWAPRPTTSRRSASRRYSGLPLFLDEAVLQIIKDRFASRGLRWTDNNAKQAMFPQGATPLRNPVGTAWGYCPEAGREGHRRRARRAHGSQEDDAGGAHPALRAEGGQDHILTKTDQALRPGRGAHRQRAGGLPLAVTTVSIGFYPRFPENHLV